MVNQGASASGGRPASQSNSKIPAPSEAYMPVAIVPEDAMPALSSEASTCLRRMRSTEPARKPQVATAIVIPVAVRRAHPHPLGPNPMS